MKTAQEVITAIESLARAHRSDARKVMSMAFGEIVRQGDVYLTRVDHLPDGEVCEERQLAPGNTKGSRHIVSESTDCVIVTPRRSSPLIGPCIESRSRLIVEHPEHGWLDLPPGIYQVTYQRDYAKERAEEIRRVMD